MKLRDRYLHAVRFFLPRAQQTDILRELREDMRAAIEDREHELGRPLQEAEELALVQQYGHPALLAGRYGTRRSLVGPELFPFYWLVLKLTLATTAVLQLALVPARLAGNPPLEAVRQTITMLPVVAFVQFGGVTLLFALLEQNGFAARLQSRWRSSRLTAFGERSELGAHPVTELVLATLFLVWWLTALRFPAFVFGAASDVVVFAPIWLSAYPAILCLAVAHIAAECLALTNPSWRPSLAVRSLVRVAAGLGGIAVAAVLLGSGDLVVRANPAERLAGTDRVIGLVNLSLTWALALAALVSAAITLLELRRLARRGRTDDPLFA